jgi:hypothetical protein
MSLVGGKYEKGRKEKEENVKEKGEKTKENGDIEVKRENRCERGKSKAKKGA